MNKIIRILHVDDNRNILKMARSVLESFGGVTVESCDSGQEAIKKAQVVKPDIILLDVMMPGMDGPTTLNNLRQIPCVSETPVVFMTGKELSDGDYELNQHGVVGSIAKPFDPLTLYKQIMEMWIYHQKNYQKPVQLEQSG